MVEYITHLNVINNGERYDLLRFRSFWGNYVKCTIPSFFPRGIKRNHELLYWICLCQITFFANKDASKKKNADWVQIHGKITYKMTKEIIIIIFSK